MNSESDHIYNIQPLKGHAEKGIFNPIAWQAEADAHLLSAKLLYSTALEAKSELETKFAKSLKKGETAIISALANKVEAHSKSAILLLGYAIETYLKSGLVRLYQYVERNDFIRIIKKHYGHILNRAASDLGIKLNPDQEKSLRRIQELILNEARYPITPKNKKHYSVATHKINSEVWSTGVFNDWLEIAETIRDYIHKIDSDRDNPAIIEPFKLGTGGYFVVRFGGNLPPYLIAKFSKAEDCRNLNTFSDIRNHFANATYDSAFANLVLQHWEQFTPLDINKCLGIK
jgi:hypothetical protein